MMMKKKEERRSERDSGLGKVLGIHCWRKDIVWQEVTGQVMAAKLV